MLVIIFLTYLTIFLTHKHKYLYFVIYKNFDRYFESSFKTIINNSNKNKSKKYFLKGMILLYQYSLVIFYQILKIYLRKNLPYSKQNSNLLERFLISYISKIFFLYSKPCKENFILYIIIKINLLIYIQIISKTNYHRI